MSEVTTTLEWSVTAKLFEGTDDEELAEFTAVQEDAGNKPISWCGDSNRIIQKLRSAALTEVVRRGISSLKAAKLTEFQSA